MAGKRGGRAPLAWAVVLLAAMAPVVGASADVAFSYLTTPDGAVMLVVPEGAEGPSPVVLVLPDALGPDRRSQPYLELLNAHGVATAELLPAGDDGRGTAPDPAENEPAGILAALSADPRVDASRLGVLAFGAGGAIALRDPTLAGAPAVLLYPGCAGLPPAARPVLLLHGGMDPTDPPGACARWTAAGGRLARRHEYAGAAYGWDYFDGPWADSFTLLPSPGGSGRRVWARSDPATTADAVSRAADFLTAELDTAGAPR